MADVKISGLPASTTPLAGTEVLPIVQSGVTKKVASDDLTVKNVRSNASTGVLQIAGPGAASIRVMTTPNANFTVARTDAAQTFTGDQTFLANVYEGTSTGVTHSLTTNKEAGSNATPLNINLSFKGYDDNELARIRSFDTTSDDGRGRLCFATAPSYAAAVVDRLVITEAGDVNVVTGNLVIGTSGKGIDFSATANSSGTMSSELLADYEEGTFTPSLGGNATYFAQTGKYTKIGRVVYFSIAIIVDSIGTGSATTISGLPFSAPASTEQGVNIVYFNALATNIVNIIGTVDSSTTVVLRSLTAAANGLGTSALFGNFADIRMTGFYFT